MCLVKASSLELDEAEVSSCFAQNLFLDDEPENFLAVSRENAREEVVAAHVFLSHVFISSSYFRPVWIARHCSKKGRPAELSNDRQSVMVHHSLVPLIGREARW